LRLFCFPYAGGAAGIFRGWSTLLLHGIEPVPIELPGHGARLMDSPISNLTTLVQWSCQAIEACGHGPFAVFGHSMGALIGYEVVRRLESRRGLHAASLLVSGCRAPQVARRNPLTYNLPDPEFTDAVRTVAGTPREVFGNPELLALVLPMLRADFKIAETYTYVAGAPLTCPIWAFGGIDDPYVRSDDLEKWMSHTVASFRVCAIPGNHFFLNESTSLLLERVVQALSEVS
jgi:medium-chain acyl-[acyl-carrier-protein] hydrolase